MTTNNHPAHGPVSLERLHQISEILSKAAAQSNGGNLGYAMADAVKVIDVAIAAFGAEPVAEIREDLGRLFVKINQPSILKVGDRLYTAPPAPVVPETLPCPVHLEPGLKFGKGVPTRFVFGALRRRAEYYAELEAMTPEQRAEHDAGIAEFKAMLGHNSRADTLQSFGNSEQLNYPATSDCWIPVSERMPDKLIPVMVMYEDGEMWSAMWNGNSWDDGTEYPDPHEVTHWREMPAAPQQEVKNG
ncbi:DUF551 domain-containing protein [Citrobacter werkmanii]|uniref:DUF551 domain-containing protein n=1 Tax=Citrobacter werkmanii TaxID=67827 RepID=UPI001CB88045|nr:DUF551 domain-containing protein [Citrobacter werkmanii]